MDAEEARKLIDAAGGDTPFAHVLGIAGTPGFQQRVNNWKRRGIPAGVMLEHLETINSLREKVSQDQGRVAA